MTEVKWLEQLSLGADDAYRTLYEQYYFRFYSLAYRYMEDEEEAKDIVQDVFYEFWQKRTQFGNVVALKSYLYKSIQNKCLDLLRHHKVRDKYLGTLKEENEFFLNQVLEEELYQELKMTINKLPEDTRKIYELTLLGHSNAEIADLLNLTLDAVKSYKKRGKKVLREKLSRVQYLFFCIKILSMVFKTNS
jgi:RNA polymerase sigma-70 factor (family 1)